MRIRSLAFSAAAVLALAGCDGLREAFSSHVDVAARAGSQELSVQRLAQLLGDSKLGIPVTKQNAQTIASLWTDYHLLGLAAARGDTVIDRKTVDEAAAGFIAGLRLERFTDSIGKTFPVDSASEAGYNSGKGGVFAARHILFGTNPTMSPAQRDSVRRAAEAVRPQVNDANFAQMAARHSTEPGAAERGGALGVFPRGMMVKEFGDAVSTLKPGEMSGLVETQFGFHIVQRLPWTAAQAEYRQMYGRASRAVAESTYLANLESKAKLAVKNDAGTKLKNALKDINAHRKDDDVLATFDGGNLTVGRMITWINGTNNAPQLVQQLQGVPDTAVNDIVKRVARNEVLLREADRMKIDIPAAQKDTIYQQFGQMMRVMWQQLGIMPKTLADSAKTPAEREKLAAARIEAFVDRLVNGQAQPVPVPNIISGLLADRYKSEMNQQAIDAALEQAQKLRVAADSTRASRQPKSAVPLGGAPGAQPGGQPGAPGGAMPPNHPPTGGQGAPGGAPHP